MANATVEKLKKWGLHHGEKVAVGLAAAVCLVLFGWALSKPTIEITPDQVSQATQQAQTNISKVPTQEMIVDQLEQAKIQEADFLGLVKRRQEGGKTAAPYVLTRDLVYQEPGAGMLRDQPELIAVANLLAHAGRGGTLVYELDDEGNVQYVDPEKVEKKPAPKRKRASPYGGMGGFAGMGQPTESALAKEEAKKKAEREAKKLERSLAGASDPEAKKAAEEAEVVEEPRGEAKTKLIGIRWVSLLGDLDHKKMRENFAQALKLPYESAHPHYLRLDVQRQVRQDDGSWPEEWEAVSVEENDKIKSTIAGVDDELAPEEVRLEGLVDPLPFLRSGLWSAVHHRGLVPEEKQTAKKAAPAGAMAGMPGYGMGSGLGYGDPGGSMEGMSAGPGSRGMMGSMPGGYGDDGTGEGYGPGGMGMMGSGGGYGPVDDTNFPKSEAEKVMVRSLDFTVEPDTTYRFRVRVVTRNPNYKVTSVVPGADNENEELTGPWSEPTNPVTVPADVTTYALDLRPTQAPPGGEPVQFNVALWNPEDGYTVVREFDRAPGQIIGEPSSATVPNAEGTRTVTKPVDYTSRQVVVDTRGGARSLEPLRLPGTSLDTPARALVVRPDGALVLRDEALDAHDSSEMREFLEIYDDAKKAVEKPKRKPAFNNPYGGMMGSGGMMGPGGP